MALPTKLTLHIVSPDTSISQEVDYVSLPGTEGDFGVLAGHAPVLSTIRDGELAVYRTQGAEPERIAVVGGFAEVSDKGLTVLAEKATVRPAVRIVVRIAPADGPCAASSSR